MSSELSARAQAARHAGAAIPPRPGGATLHPAMLPGLLPPGGILPGQACGTAPARAAPEESLAHPGWRVVAGAFLQSLAAFFVAYSFASFAAPIEAGTQAARAEVVAIYAIYTAVMLGLAPLGGLVADRFGTRAACLAGTALMATGLLLAAERTSLAGLHLCYGAVVGLGLALVYTPCFAVVPRWFARRRGLASGIAASGAAVGTMLGVPLCDPLVAMLGWEKALSVLAIGLLGFGGLGALLLAEAPAPAGAASGPTLREAVTSRRFVRFLAANLLSAFAILIPLAQLVPHARGQGLDAALIPYLMTLVGLGSLAGRVLLGSLADRLGRTRSLGLLLMALGSSFLLWALGEGVAPLGLFALVYGAAYGAIISLRASVVVDNFRCRSMSTLTGLLNSVMSIGTLGGTLLLGLAHDHLGSYAPAILATGLAAVVAGLLILPLGRGPARG